MFDNEDTFPDLDFIITGLERPLKLHKNILSQTSELVKGILKAKQASNSGDGNIIKWMFDTNKEVDREALVKVLRFCYGDAVIVGVNNGECCAVIATLFRLKVICAVETATQLSKFVVDQADRNLSMGAQLLVATQRYPECTNASFCAVDRQLAEIVLSKEQMKEDYKTVVDSCLMKLPAKYLDTAKYGDAHTKWSEFTTRARYLRYHSESLSKKEKDEILKKCDWNTLESEELKELKELGLVEGDTITGIHHDTLECMEGERNYWRTRAINTEKEAEKRREEDKRTIKRLENTVQGLRTVIRLWCKCFNNVLSISSTAQNTQTTFQ